MADKSGIDAVNELLGASSPGITGPKAIPTFVAGPDGTVHVVYIDAQTGAVVQNLTGYTISSAGGSLPGSDTTTPEDSPVSKNIQKPQDKGHTTSGKNEGAGKFGQPKSGNQNPMENYGYMHKPSLAFKAASMVPGMAIPATMASHIVNLNNQAAAAEARDMLGLPNTTKDAVKGFLKDNQGQVSNNAQINDKSYHIGFEAMSPDNKTNLTPMEARNRAAILGGITEPGATAPAPSETQESADPKSRVEQATGLTKGWATKAIEGVTGAAKGWARTALDNLFGTNDSNLPDTAPTPTSRPETTSAPAKTSTPTAGFVSHPNTPSTPNAPSTTPGSAYGVGYSRAYGQYRPDDPNASVIDAAQKAVAETLGPGYTVLGVSGQQTAAQKAQIERGKAAISKAKAGKTLTQQEKADAKYASKTENKNNRHPTGLAIDATVKDPTGQTVSKEQMQHVAAQFAYNNPTAGIGYGPGYMKEAEAHLDLTGTANSWGAGGTKATMDPTDKGMFDQAREAGKQTQEAVSQGYQATPGFFTGAVPSARPDPTNTGFVSQDERTVDKSGVPGVAQAPNALKDLSQLSTNAGKAINQAVESKQANTFAAIGTRPSNANVTDMSRISPAQAAAMGITARTPAEKAAMAKAIAGELSQKTLDALSKNDPVAKAEVANMAAVMENRAASTTKNTMGFTSGVLGPSQINSMMPSNMATTNQNYGTYAKALDQAVNDFYSGKLAPSTPDATHYYNPDAANPSWGPQLQDPSKVDQHVFGKLPGEYTPGPGFRDTIGNYMKDSPSETGSRFGGTGLGTPGETNRGSGSYGGGYGTGPGTGSSPGGSAGQSGGAGYSPGGMNSPSGSGFGSPSSSGTNSGLGGPTSNNSGNKSSSSKGLGSGANTNGQGTASAGSKSRSEGWF